MWSEAGKEAREEDKERRGKGMTRERTVVIIKIGKPAEKYLTSFSSHYTGAGAFASFLCNHNMPLKFNLVKLISVTSKEFRLKQDVYRDRSTFPS